MSTAIEPELAALVAVVREPDAEGRLRADPHDFLRAHGVAEDPALALSGPRAVERMLLYRRLVHARIRGAFVDLLPRSAALLGPEGVERIVVGFVAASGPRTPFLRDVAGELATFLAAARDDGADVPAYLADLARFEALEVEIRNRPAGGEGPTGVGVKPDVPLAFDGTTTLASFAFAVHERGAADGPRAGHFDLLGYGDPAHVVRWLVLTPFAARLLALLLPGLASVAEALPIAAAGDDEALANAVSLLATLADRGVLRGSVAP